MISKANIQLIKGLQDKKQRQKYDQFIVEGEKSITELLKSNFELLRLFALDTWLEENRTAIGNVATQEVTEKELAAISVHMAPQKALAIVKLPPFKDINSDQPYILALDEIQDPGNLGTIVRIADWYGIKQIICSKGCTDIYSPKCINSTMGSFLRVNLVYDDILKTAEKLSYPLIVTALNGENIHTAELPNKGIVVIGNEGHGIKNEIIKAASIKLSIPKFGEAESLNAAISTAIVLDNLIR